MTILINWLHAAIPKNCWNLLSKVFFLIKMCHLFLPNLVISFSGWLWATYLLTKCSHNKNDLFFLPKLVIYFTKKGHFFYNFFRLAMHNLLIDFMQPYQNLFISCSKITFLLPKVVYYFAKIGHFFQAGYEQLINRLHAAIPKMTSDGTRLQMIVCSATLHAFEVKKMAERLMHFPTWVDLKVMFVFSKKATKIDEIFTVNLTLTT